MIACSWEIVGDSRQFSRKGAVDPHYPTPCEKAETAGQKHDHNAMGRNAFSCATTREELATGAGRDTR